MALFAPIQNPEPSDMFQSLINQIIQQKQNAGLMKQNQLEQEQKAKQFEQTLGESQKYHKGLLDLKNQQLKQSTPQDQLKMDLLKAKIESEKAKLQPGSKPTEFQKSISKEDAKNLSESNKHLYSALDMQPTIDVLKDSIKDPVMESMKKNPLLMGKDIAYYKINGTPEQQKLLGAISSANKLMYSDLAQRFKGAFRAGEQQLFSQLLPDEKDSIGIMIGKIEGIDSLNKSMIKRLSFVDDIVRNKGFTQSKAMEAANKFFDTHELEKEIKNKIKKEKIEEKESNKDEQTLNKTFKLKNKYNGEEKEISMEEAKNLGYIK